MNQYVIQVMKARLKNILHLLAAMLLVAELSSCTEEPLFEERARVIRGASRTGDAGLPLREESRGDPCRTGRYLRGPREQPLRVHLQPAGEVHYRKFFTDGISYSGDYSKVPL